MRARPLFAPALLALALHACAPHAPRIRLPDKIEPFCGSKQARTTSVASAMTSTNDRMATSRPNEMAIRRELAAAGGVIEHWDAGQLLKLPNTSQRLGETDGYARVSSVAVPIAAEGAQTRPIYLLVQDHGFPRWIEMQAYDVQNVCVEGRRES
jgi:hypothetical protein